MRDVVDFIVDNIVAIFFILILVGLVCLFVSAIKYDYEHPCLKYSKEEHHYFILVGKVLVPQTSHDCLERK